MRKVDHAFSYLEYESEGELPPGDLGLLRRARTAMMSAYSPYSRFYVGAAVSLKTGEIITGNNQENMAFPSGLCAERVALFSASASHPGIPVNAIAISAYSENFEVSEPVPPCGACRQAMIEYEMLNGKEIRVIFSGEKGKVIVVNSIRHLLPLSFNEQRLKNES